MEAYSQRIDGGCKSHHNSHSHDTSVEEIVNQPITTPLTSVELKLQSKLTRRSLAASPEENVLRIKTGGQVCNYLTTIENALYHIVTVATHICTNTTAKSGVWEGS